MPLETNIEYRKRLFFNGIIGRQLEKDSYIEEAGIKAIERGRHALCHPRNFSDFNRTVSYFDRYISEETEEHHPHLITFMERCMIIYEQKGGVTTVVNILRRELKEKGKTEQEINETIARGH